MSGKVFFLLIRSRFSGGYLAGIASLGVIVLLSSTAAISTSVPSSVLSVSVGYVSVFLVLLLLLTTFSGAGNPYSKADQDFLLQMPIPKKVLIPAVLLTQFLSFGVMFFMISLEAMFTHLNSPQLMALIGADGFLLGFMITLVAVAVYNSSYIIRVPVGIGLAALIVSGNFGFSFSPISEYGGHYLTGTAVLVTIVAVSLYFALSQLSRGIEPRQRISLRSTYSKGVEYGGSSPLVSVFLYHFKLVVMAGQGNAMARSGRQTFSGRLMLWQAILIMSVLGIIFAVILSIPGLVYSTTVTGIETISPGIGFLAPFYISFFPTTFFIGGVIPLERVWISATTFPPRTYFLTTIGSKMVQSLSLEAPFAVSVIVARILGYPIPLIFLVIFLVVVPLYVSNFIIFSTFARPVQVTDSGASQGRSSVRNLIAGIPTFIFAFSFFIILFVSAAVVVPIILYSIILLYSVLRGNFWKNAVNKMVDRGYV